MGKEYQQLGSEERAVMMVMRYQYRGVRTIARMLKRSPSTISRELARNAGTGARYDAKACGARAQSLRFKCRSVPKLGADTALFGVVAGHLREGWSPEQTAGTLKRMWPDDATQRVSHETIYNALYLLPRGELRAELIACLRQGHAGRWKRSRGVDRRGQIRDMVSLHVRPPEVADRQIPGHWEGDLIRGAYSRSAVGTLVERSSRRVMLARMTGVTASAALESFSCLLNGIPVPMRKTLTYDRGKEMSRHADLTERTGVKVYFADPHSPWQRGSNENANGLLRQYLPRTSDLSVHSQDQLDAIAGKLNTRPRKILGFRTPIEVYTELLHNAQINPPATVGLPVALGT